MTAQNEEKMREAFEKTWGQFGFTDESVISKGGVRELCRQFMGIIYKGEQERKQLQADMGLQKILIEQLRKRLESADAALDTALSEFQKREAELQERVKELEDLNKLMDEGMSAEHAKTIASLRAELTKYKEAKPVAWRVSNSNRNGIYSQKEFTNMSFDFGKYEPLYAHPDNAKE